MLINTLKAIMISWWPPSRTRSSEQILFNPKQINCSSCDFHTLLKKIWKVFVLLRSMINICFVLTQCAIYWRSHQPRHQHMNSILHSCENLLSFGRWCLPYIIYIYSLYGPIPHFHVVVVVVVVVVFRKCSNNSECNNRSHEYKEACIGSSGSPAGKSIFIFFSTSNEKRWNVDVKLFYDFKKDPFCRIFYVEKNRLARWVLK